MHPTKHQDQMMRDGIINCLLKHNNVFDGEMTDLVDEILTTLPFQPPKTILLKRIRKLSQLGAVALRRPNEGTRFGRVNRITLVDQTRAIKSSRSHLRVTSEPAEPSTPVILPEAEEEKTSVSKISTEIKHLPTLVRRTHVLGMIVTLISEEEKKGNPPFITSSRNLLDRLAETHVGFYSRTNVKDDLRAFEREGLIVRSVMGKGFAAITTIALKPPHTTASLLNYQFGGHDAPKTSDVDTPSVNDLVSEVPISQLSEEKSETTVELTRKTTMDEDTADMLRELTTSLKNLQDQHARCKEETLKALELDQLVKSLTKFIAILEETPQSVRTPTFENTLDRKKAQLEDLQNECEKTVDPDRLRTEAYILKLAEDINKTHAVIEKLGEFKG